MKKSLRVLLFRFIIYRKKYEKSLISILSKFCHSFSFFGKDELLNPFWILESFKSRSQSFLKDFIVPNCLQKVSTRMKRLSKSSTNVSVFWYNTAIIGCLAWKGTIKSLKVLSTYILLAAIAGSFCSGAHFILTYLWGPNTVLSFKTFLFREDCDKVFL